jgi:polyhydroxybutyrate depolymerase
MGKMKVSIVFGVTSLLGLACSSTDEGAPHDGSRGGSDSGAGSGGVTAASSGGSSSSAGAGGRSGGGANGGSGGGSVSGGAGGAGAGGVAGGGSGGGTGARDAGGASGMAAASAGCGKAGRPSGGIVSVANDHYFMFPAGYDGKTPLPVLVGFHGCGNVNRGDGTNSGTTEYVNLTKGTAFETEYVRAVPLSADAGGCWAYNNDIPRITKMYDDLLANYCVDKSRVFASGHSSGAQMIVQILLQNHQSDARHLNFKGVAPVAASDYGVLSGPMPVLYIQGKMDQERGGGDGHETVARLRTANACGDTSQPYSQVMGCQSGTTTVVPGCITYDGCQAPTIWCSHNDPAYSGTMHGVPCFGMKAIYDFFESLP